MIRKETIVAKVEYRAQHMGEPGVTVLTTVHGEVPRMGDNVCLVDGWASEGVYAVDLLVYSNTWVVTLRMHRDSAEALRAELAETV